MKVFIYIMMVGQTNVYYDTLTMIYMNSPLFSCHMIFLSHYNLPFSFSFFFMKITKYIGTINVGTNGSDLCPLIKGYKDLIIASLDMK